jgi:hypothetical protein
VQTLKEGDTISHNTFGEGKILKFNKNEKYVYIKFAIGEKKFIFPDAFLQCYLKK